MLQNLRKTPHGVNATLQTIKMLQAEEVAKAKLPVPASWDQVRLNGMREFDFVDIYIVNFDTD